MNLHKTPARHWNVRELVVIGIFAATAKLTTLMVALAGGGLNPVSLMAKNLIFTVLLIIMLYKVRKAGTLILYVLVNVLVSMMLLGTTVSLLASMLCGALTGEVLILLTGGYKRSWAPLVGAAGYDLACKVASVGISFLVNRENPAMLYMMVPIVAIGYLGSLAGLYSGVKAVKELRHAGIIRS